MNMMDIVKLKGYKRHANTNGGEYVGPCPVCGGKDRFHAWPETGRFWCRKCEKSGDLIEYFRWAEGMSYPSACEAVGCEPKIPVRHVSKLGDLTDFRRAAWERRHPILDEDELGDRLCEWKCHNCDMYDSLSLTCDLSESGEPLDLKVRALQRPCG
jgi:hypothetical protein